MNAKNTPNYILPLLFALFFYTLLPAQTIYHVTTTGTGNGSSWASTCSFQMALDSSSAGDTIWVAVGSYIPTSNYGVTPITATNYEATKHFRMKNGVAIYGGFLGNETQLSQRDWVNNVTIFTGKLGPSEIPSDSCAHVFYHPSSINIDSTAVLDGFTITGGSYTIAANPLPTEFGAGMFNDIASPTLRNLIFTRNIANGGAGIYNDNSSPKMYNIVFENNKAITYGGAGMYNYGNSNPLLVNGYFLNNRNGALVGGGIYYNVNFINNIGLAIFKAQSVVLSLTNCIIWGNKNAGNNAQILLYGGITTLNNCSYLTSNDIWLNLGAAIIENNCQHAYPMFVDTMMGDYRLQGCSPCVNAGLTSAFDTLLYGNKDIRGESRIFNYKIDIGAYEWNYPIDPCLAQYSIQYKPNLADSGTVPPTQFKTYLVDITLDSNIGLLKRTNYNFMGWNSLADGSGIDFAGNSIYSTDSTLILFAKWESTIGIFESEKENISIYPNPAKDKLNLLLPEFKGTARNLEILNLFGSVVLHQSLNQTHNVIDISALPQGCYIININNQIRTKVLKVE